MTQARPAGEISGKGGSYGSDYKVVTDTSVGNVCKHAQSGDVDIAFVYTSDVYRFGSVEIVGTVPGDTHKNIVYPGAITRDCKNVDATKEFLDWCMNSEKARQSGRSGASSWRKLQTTTSTSLFSGRWAQQRPSPIFDNAILFR